MNEIRGIKNRIDLSSKDPKKDHRNEVKLAEHQLVNVAAENIPGMIYRMVMTEAGQLSFDYFSRQGSALFEGSENLTPQDFVDMIHPEDRVYFQLKWTESINEMSPLEWRGRVCLPTANEKYMLLRSIPSKGEKNSIVWDGIMMDITEQGQEELALRTALEVIQEKESTLENLIISMPGVVYQWLEHRDGSGRLTYMSPKLKEYFDLEPEDLNFPSNYLHPEDRQRWRNSIDLCNQTGAPWNFEGRLLYPDGKVKWWRGHSKGVSLANGDHLYTGIMFDITQDKLNSLKEKEISERFAAVASILPDLIFSVNASLQVLEVFSGPRQQQLLSSENFVGKNLSRLVDGNTLERFKEVVAKTRADGVVRVLEFEIVIDQSTQYLEARVAKINEEQILFVMRDNSERIMLEVQNKKQQVKLFEAARLSNLGEVAAGIAHEINNPLAVISSHCSVLSKTVQQKEVIDAATLNASVEKIAHTTKRIAKIISSLRTIAKEASTEPISQVSVDEIFKDLLNFCGEKMRFQKVGLAIELESQDLMISARPTQLTQALLSLVLNSIQAITNNPAPEYGGVIGWIRLSCHQVRGLIRIQIIDSGPGVPSHHLQKIFQPFFTTKDIGEGTGLGLATARGVVESHGGRLFYDETASHTCFVIELPQQA